MLASTAWVKARELPTKIATERLLRLSGLAGPSEQADTPNLSSEKCEEIRRNKTKHAAPEPASSERDATSSKARASTTTCTLKPVFMLRDCSARSC